MVQCCIEANTQKYLQSYSTPFLQPPLLQQCGYDGLTPQATSIIQGTYTPSSTLSPTTQDYLLHLRQDPAVPNWSTRHLYISTESHQRAWRKAKERTASSPSQLHFGLWKANATIPQIAEMDAAMRYIPFTTGYSLKRWQTGIDVELQKDPDNYNIERLRTIVLIEADHNMNNKYLGSQTMAHAEKHGAIDNDQYGSRKQRSAILVSLNNRLTADIMRQQHVGGAFISTDAKSCYDRITHPALSLSLQRLGVPKSPIQSTIHTLQRMQHHIKTIHGVSSQKYGPTNPPLQGVVQGHGTAPTGWVAVSTPLIQMLRTKGFGFHHTAVLSNEPVTLTCFSFVDDTDLIQSRDTAQTDHQFLDQVQRMVRTWEEGLRATGGALVPSKSFWYWIDFKWDRDKWRYKTQRELPGSLVMRDGSTPSQASEHILSRLEITSPRKALGIPVRHDGIDSSSVKYLRTKAINWAAKIQQSTLSKQEAWLAMTHTIWKTIEYPLAVTAFTPMQCQDIMSPALQAGLAKSGIQRRLPRLLVHGPIQALGLGVKSLYMTQVERHIQIILTHSQEETSTGKLLRSSLELLQLELGTIQPVLTLPWQPWSELATPCWLKHTWRDLAHYGFQIKDRHSRPTHPGPSRATPLMDLVVEQGRVSAHQLHEFNICRQYLHIFWDTDLLSASGSQLDPHLWSGKPSLSHRSALRWPRHGTPSKQAWTTWRIILRQLFLSSSTTASLTLRSPYPSASATTRACTWTAFASIGHHRVYTTNGNAWQVWHPQPHRQTRYKKFFRAESSTTPSLPAQLLRVTINSLDESHICLIDTAETIFTIPSVSRPSPSHSTPPQRRLVQQVANLAPTIQWAIRNFRAQDDGRPLAAAIAAQQGYAVSDGSWKEGRGTSAFLLGDLRSPGTILGEGVNCTPPGDPKAHSQRSELSGLLGTVLLIETVCKLHGITSGRVEVACDSTGALRAGNLCQALAPNQPDYDLLKDIQTLVLESPLEWTWRHVKGHQSLSHLDHWAKWNHLADSKAKGYWNQLQAQHSDHEPPHPYQPISHWSLWQDGQPWSYLNRERLHWVTHGTKLQQWWVTSGRISEFTAQKACWTSYGKAMQSLSPARRRWVTKHLSNNCGVNATLVKWKYRRTSQCPRCQQDNETTSHLIQCMTPEASQVWTASIAHFRQRMSQLHTDPRITDIWITHLQAHREGTLPIEPLTYHARFLRCLREQNAMSWGSFADGFLSSRWKAAQELFDQWKGHPSRNKEEWLGKVIVAILQVVRDQWDHRNRVEHDPDGPSNQAMRHELQQAIQEELHIGQATLPNSVWHHFTHHGPTLFQKSTVFQQHWLVNLEAARQQYTSTPLSGYASERAALRNWIRTGRTH